MCGNIESHVGLFEEVQASALWVWLYGFINMWFPTTLTLLEPVFARLSKMESRLPGLRPASLPVSAPLMDDPPSSICLLNGCLFLHEPSR